jgi:DNA-binding response OmpR family regulator
MRIVSLEDDEPFWDLMKDALVDAFPGIELSWIRTESEFRERLEKFAAAPPDLFILDVMVKWADPAENMPLPTEDVREEKYYRAGLRCRKRLAQNSATSSVPVILFTVLEAADISKLPQGAIFVGKSGDFRELITAISNLMSRSFKSPTRRHPSLP